MQNYRLFIGIPLNKHLIKGVRYGIDRLEAELPMGSFRFYKENLWHFTLLFLSNQKQEDLGEILLAVREFANQQFAFSGKLTKIDYGPDKRMIWLFADEEFALQGERARDLLQDLLLEKKVSFNPENKRFLPHVTLARRERDFQYRGNLKEIKETLKEEVVVEKIELISSTLTKGGPEYEVLANFDLQAPML